MRDLLLVAAGVLLGLVLGFVAIAVWVNRAIGDRP